MSAFISRWPLNLQFLLIPSIIKAQNFIHKNMKALLTLILIVIIVNAASESSIMPNKIMPLNDYKSSCDYTATIKTSCSSRPSTTDLISLAFGDVDGNMVYVARLDDPESGRFQQCWMNKIEINGERCMNQICSIQLIRFGDDGWMPETVTIDGPNSVPLTVAYNVFLPYGEWYGVDNCYSSLHYIHASQRLQ